MIALKVKNMAFFSWILGSSYACPRMTGEKKVPL
jgi:hypothetical protein